MDKISHNEFNEKSGVYAIENTVTGMKYIGSTKNLYSRFICQRNFLNINSFRFANKHLRDDWHKYGESCFKFTVLELCNSDKLREREQFWLDETNSVYPNGYNIRTKVDTNAGLPGYWTGKKLSAEASKKMSLSKRALHLKSPQAQKVGLFDNNGKLVATYRSMLEAATILNISPACISRSIVLNYKTRKGLWKKIF